MSVPGPTDGALMPLDDEPETALVPTRRPPVANSLEEAPLHSLVYINQEGQVQPLKRARIMQGVTWGAVGLAWVATCLLFTAAFGVIGLAGATVFSGLMGNFVRDYVRLRRATECVVADRLDEAESLASAIAESRLSSTAVRAQATQLLGAVASFKSRPVDALAHFKAARELYGKNPKQVPIHAKLLVYAEVAQLVNLGNLDEARARLDAVKEIPQADYARLQHWTAEMYLAFAEGRVANSEDELHERSRFALQSLPAVPLLALCAWAFGELGDADMSTHLLGTAQDRWAPPTSRSLILLDQWIQAQPEAQVEDGW